MPAILLQGVVLDPAATAAFGAILVPVWGVLMLVGRSYVEDLKTQRDKETARGDRLEKLLFESMAVAGAAVGARSSGGR